jgi:hypothetical protein
MIWIGSEPEVDASPSVTVVARYVTTDLEHNDVGAIETSRTHASGVQTRGCAGV